MYTTMCLTHMRTHTHGTTSSSSFNHLSEYYSDVNVLLHVCMYYSLPYIGVCMYMCVYVMRVYIKKG